MLWRHENPSTINYLYLIIFYETKNSPHTSTYSFLVSPCSYYFNHFKFTSPDSIYTIDVPPRIRKLHNHFLYTLSFSILLFLYLSRLFCEILQICWVGYPRIKIFSKASLFFNFHYLTHSVLTFCLPRNYFLFTLTTEISCLFT
jgi:hypothetical protein